MGLPVSRRANGCWGCASGDATTFLRRVSGAPCCGPRFRHDLCRPTRLRWLLEGEQGERRWDAFVAPAGMPLVEAMKHRNPLDWEEAQAILEALSAELDLAEKEGNLPADLSLSQVWV